MFRNWPIAELITAQEQTHFSSACRLKAVFGSARMLRAAFDPKQTFHSQSPRLILVTVTDFGRSFEFGVQKMAIFRNIPWPRVFAEGVIIVFSILMALWVDAWWNDRQDAVEERAILIQLRAETVQLLENIAINRTRVKAIQGSTTTLANLSIHGAKPDQADKVDRLLRDFMWHVDGSFTDAPVLESLFFTGDLKLISNGELRREIAETRVRLHRLQAEIQRELNFYDETVVRFLQQNADLAQFYTHESFEPGFPATPDTSYVYPGLKQSPFRSQIEVLEHQEFQNILLHRLTLLINAVWWWENNELDEGLRRVLVLIDQETVGF